VAVEVGRCGSHGGHRERGAYGDHDAGVGGHGGHHTTLVHWRERLPTQECTGDRPAGTLSGHFFALRIRPAGRAVREGLPQHGDGVLPDCWLLVQWPPGHDEPSDYWLSDLPADTPLNDLVHLAKSRWRIEHDYRELKPASASTTSKAAPSSAGTATSPSPPPPHCSSPSSGPPT
jgi:hypothetical protein